ncbi:Uncharacterised protein [Salmonella enterica subsp. enterica serovar Bovismorbificans]|uniref:Uncharacterized protein n=1 Tax=Salmonella enterica subsp. enterica serovar Bovismorbificans TaxID=58097 RepID=A0A655DHC1_SALET|nr:Uncharacterised protein [Salmonella enterica subsp. enterica serovar Bovismorbificans]
MGFNVRLDNRPDIGGKAGGIIAHRQGNERDFKAWRIDKWQEK